MTGLLDQLRGWSLARQRLTHPANAPLDALEAVVGVYSSHPSAPLSLNVRTQDLTAASFRALESRRRVVRIPAMRVSIFLAPTSTASRIFAATAMSADQHVRRLTSRGLNLDDYRRLTPRVLAAAGEPRTPRELAGSAGHTGQKLGAVLRMLTYEGLLLRVGARSLRSDNLRYVATEAWLGRPLVSDPAACPREEALAWLAGRYLRAFGPARAADFAWWAGVAMGRARQAVAAHATVDVGEGLLLPAEDEAAFTGVRPPAGSVVVLPKWDAYTMGYAPDGRARFVHPEVQPRVYTGRGDGLPVVLVDGQAVGTWTFRKGAGPTLEPFDSLGSRARAAVEARFAAIRGLLDAP